MRSQRIVANLLLTFGLGVVVGILFAPKSGEQTRKILAGKIEQYCGSTCTSIVDQMAMFRGRMGEYLSDLKEKAEDIK
ncbi:MAG: YtxH domain-containing protein [Actinomycetota bacterium]|nr:YtxH domain-containing protein [Actinomycetota bacterium]